MSSPAAITLSVETFSDGAGKSIGICISIKHLRYLFSASFVPCVSLFCTERARAFCDQLRPPRRDVTSSSLSGPTGQDAGWKWMEMEMQMQMLECVLSSFPISSFSILPLSAAVMSRERVSSGHFTRARPPQLALSGQSLPPLNWPQGQRRPVRTTARLLPGKSLECQPRDRGPASVYNLVPRPWPRPGSWPADEERDSAGRLFTLWRAVVIGGDCNDATR